MAAVTFLAPLPLGASWTGWADGGWSSGTTSGFVYDPVLGGFGWEVYADGGTLVPSSGPFAGTMVRLLGDGLSAAADDDPDAPLPDSGTITGFRLYDRYEPLLSFDDEADTVTVDDGVPWDGAKLLDATGFSIEVPELAAAEDRGAAFSEALLAAEPMLSGPFAPQGDDAPGPDEEGEVPDPEDPSTPDGPAPDAPGIPRVIAAGDGAVRLDGTIGDEALIGNDGRNILVGFGGTDTMTGGAGADIFVLTALGDAESTIDVTDWAAGTDRLAIDDRLLGIGGADVAVRALTWDVARDILEAGAASFDRGTGTLSLDGDGDGVTDAAASMGAGAALGLDDVILL